MTKTSLYYIFGPQGAGKGTQAKALLDYFNGKGFSRVEHVSSGTIFRKHIGEKTDLGIEAKKFIDKGNLVPDDTTVAMVSEYLKDLNNPDVVILDGFPRNTNQHEILMSSLEDLGIGFTATILLEADEDVVVSRLSGRRTCPSGHIFHVDYIIPKVAGICDDCGGELSQRDDDIPEAIKKRLDIYNKQTVPIIEMLEKANLPVLRVNAEPSIKEVTDEMLLKIDDFLG